MIEQQEIKCPNYKLFSSEILKIRENVMEWLCEIGEDVQMTSEGIHKATTFFEQMLSKKQLKGAV